MVTGKAYLRNPHIEIDVVVAYSSVPLSTAKTHALDGGLCCGSDSSFIDADSSVIEADVQWVILLTHRGMVVTGKAHLRNQSIDNDVVPLEVLVKRCPQIHGGTRLPGFDVAQIVITQRG